eukprot:jgi/Mesen1/2060/ME000150S01155
MASHVLTASILPCASAMNVALSSFTPCSNHLSASILPATSSAQITCSSSSSRTISMVGSGHKSNGLRQIRLLSPRHGVGELAMRRRTVESRAERWNDRSQQSPLSESATESDAAGGQSDGEGEVLGGGAPAQQLQEDQLLLQPAKASVKDWLEVAGALFVFGAILGPPLDGFHSEVELQLYDIGAVTVFPMLGAMYSVVGTIQVALDHWLAKPGQLEPGRWERVLASVGVLIGLLRLSAQLYDDELNYSIIFALLLVGAQGNWYVFDRTPAGWVLAACVAVFAPLSEVVIMKFFGLWHYEQPDIFIEGEGLVSWTACCYFFYTQFVTTLARALATSIFPPVPGQEVEKAF